MSGYGLLWDWYRIPHIWIPHDMSLSTAREAQGSSEDCSSKTNSSKDTEIKDKLKGPLK